MRQKKFQGKLWYPLPIHKNFDKRTFLKTEGVPYESFRYCEKINFRQNRDTPSYAISLFQKLSEKKVLLGVLPVLWDKKVSRESRDNPLLAIKISVKRKFLKNEGFPYKNLRYCERINFRQSRDTPSYAIFLIQKISGKNGPPRSSFYCETKKFREKIVISPFYPETFPTKETFWKKKGSPTKFFGTLRKSIIDRIVIQYLMQFF